MKIYDGRYVISGLIVFIALATFPVWFNRGKVSPSPEPKLDTPAILEMVQKKCVLAKDEMRIGHMRLLDQWRTEVVRNGRRIYTGMDGKIHEMSFQNECLKCHSNKTTFCDTCHRYVGLSSSTPYCWTCHIAPREND